MEECQYKIGQLVWCAYLGQAIQVKVLALRWAGNGYHVTVEDDSGDVRCYHENTFSPYLSSLLNSIKKKAKRYVRVKV